MFSVTKKIIGLLLCVTMLFTVGTVTFADEIAEEQNESVQIDDVNNQVTDDSNDIEISDEDEIESGNTTETNTVVDKEQSNDEGAVDVDTTEEDANVTEGTAETDSTDNTVIPSTFEVMDADFAVQVNGVDVSFEDVGMKKITVAGGDITLVPLRKIAEMLNCTVAWRASDQTVHIFKNGKSMMLTINKPEIIIHNFEVGTKFVYTSEPETKYVYSENLSVTPILESERTFVPLRAISENLDTTVNFVDGLITITDNNEEMKAYTPTIADIKARNLIENYNFKPIVEIPAPTTGSVTVKAYGNFPNAPSDLGIGITVQIAGNTQTVGSDKTCTFDEIEVGDYIITVGNIPAGYVVGNSDMNVTVVPGEETSVTIYLNKDENYVPSEDNSPDEVDTDEETEKAENPDSQTDNTIEDNSDISNEDNSTTEN